MVLRKIIAVKCDVCGKYLLSNTDMITHRNIHQVVSSPQRRNFKRSADGELKMVVQLNDQNLEHIGDITRRTETFSKVSTVIKKITIAFEELLTSICDLIVTNVFLLDDV